MAEYIDYNMYINKKTLNQLKEVVDEYSKTYNNTEYASDNILKDFDYNDYKEQIDALTNAINDIGIKEGLDFEKAGSDYNSYIENNPENDYYDYMKELVEEGNQDKISSFLGHKGLELSEQYQAHENAKITDPEYKENVEKYSIMTAQRESMFEEEGGTTLEFELEYGEIFRKLRNGPPAGKLIDRRDIFDCINILEESREAEQTKEETNDKSFFETIKEKVGTLFNRNENSIQEKEEQSKSSFWQNIKDKFSGLFNRDKNFEEEIITPAENEIANGVEDNKTSNNILEYVEKELKENVYDKLNILKEDSKGALENIDELTIGDQELEEVSKDNNKTIENDGQEEDRIPGPKQTIHIR